MSEVLKASTRLRTRWEYVAAPAAPKYVCLVFFQGSDADEVLDLIDQEGVEQTVTHLAGWDYGQESVDAAIANGGLYDELPWHALDRVVEHDGYHMVYNPDLGHVGLYHQVTPADTSPTSSLVEAAFPTLPGQQQLYEGQRPQHQAATSVGQQIGREL